MRFVLATHNPHKRDELLAVLRHEIGVSIEVLTLDELETTVGDIPETGTTLEENAKIKAETVHRLTGLPALADDTGLEVDVLSGAPGVYSARYAGDNASYSDNVDKLLSELQMQVERAARFRTVLCFVDEQGAAHTFEGEVHGHIIEAPRGAHGFGYDPVFAPDEDPGGRTFAQMSPEEKNAISHRGRALRSFAAWLKRR